LSSRGGFPTHPTVPPLADILWLYVVSIVPPAIALKEIGAGSVRANTVPSRPLIAGAVALLTNMVKLIVLKYDLFAGVFCSELGVLPLGPTCTHWDPLKKAVACHCPSPPK
jgi:hypothetical protein